MFKKIKDNWKEFISARRRIKELEHRQKILIEQKQKLFTQNHEFFGKYISLINQFNNKTR